MPALASGIDALRDRLRSDILDGRLAPGAPLPQGPLAESLGVSRTPIREALRMLQEEGLVTSEPNCRMRVAELSVPDLETIYAHRVLLEPLALAVSVPRFTDADRVALRDAVASMDAATDADDLAGWQGGNARFHDLLTSRAGDDLRASARRHAQASDRYRRLRIETGPGARAAGQAEHRAILDAALAGDASLAAGHLARHLARTALGLVAELRPDHDPATVRTALRLVADAHGPTDVRL